MKKVVYYSRLGEAVCEECGAGFGASDFESAKEHDENPCKIDTGTDSTGEGRENS